MRSAHDYRAHVLRHLRINPIVERSLDDCLGLALASQHAAAFPLPPFTNSAMDGYAVRAADTGVVPVQLPVRGDIAAGNAGEVPLEPGTTRRIMTGAPLPPGSDAVVRVEWTDGGTDVVRIDQTVEPGAEVRLRGDDIAAGDVVGRPREAIEAADIALFASLGLDRLNVHRAPRVGVVATGDELIEVGQPLRPGGIFDSNSHQLAALARSSGAEVVSAIRLTDNLQPAVAALIDLSQRVDLIITAGGISAGAYEVIKDVFAELGGVDFCSVAIQPGKPQGFGFLSGTPVIALPGNPVSALVSFELFVRPAIRKLAGFDSLFALQTKAATTTSLRGASERTRFVPAVVDLSTHTVTAPQRSGSHLVAKAAGANCLVEIPAGTKEIPAGDKVMTHLIRWS